MKKENFCDRFSNKKVILTFDNVIDTNVDTGWSSLDSTRFYRHSVNQGLIRKLAFLPSFVCIYFTISILDSWKCLVHEDNLHIPRKNNSWK
jgi:hypothetical protein